jgi:hypothetical protein
MPYSDDLVLHCEACGEIIEEGEQVACDRCLADLCADCGCTCEWSDEHPECL